ncbi:hypothetical protein FQZ97_1214290 [compost metagenome]
MRSTRGERTTPTAAKLSGQRSSTHKITGARFSFPRRMAGMPTVMCEGSNTKMTSARNPRNNQGPQRQAPTAKLR